jgi:hypothetical protein
MRVLHTITTPNPFYNHNTKSNLQTLTHSPAIKHSNEVAGDDGQLRACLCAVEVEAERQGSEHAAAESVRNQNEKGVAKHTRLKDL